MVFPNEYEIEWNDNNTYNSEVDRADSALYYVDLQIGRLLTDLEENGKAENTVIIFSTDHGHDWYSKHYIKGHGKSIYDEELKVPLIFYIPDLKAQKIEERVSHIDVLPTVLTLMQIDYNETEFIGKPMSENRRFFFYTQSHKYLIGMMNGDNKTIIDLNRNLVEVYDLSISPEERGNLVYKKQNDEDILELLMWHHCQLNYFSVDKPDLGLAQYCENFG